MLVLEGQLGAVSQWTASSSLRAAGLPAFIYAFQNLLLQYAYRNVDGLTFNLTNQTKTIFVAVFLFFMVGQRQSRVQIAALALLVGKNIANSCSPSPF